MHGGILKNYMYINLELYRIFYMTAKLGSISKAAKELFTSQPAISQSIRQLEDKLGGQLFYRNARGVTLTTEGEVLFQYIEQGYAMMETAERKYKELRELSAGQLRISACSEILKHVLLTSICIFNQCHPGIRIQIKDESSSEILRKLERGDIDLGIINLYSQDESNIDIIDILELQDCFVTGERYRGLSERKVSMEDLVKNYPIILLQKGGNTRAYIDDYFRAKGIDLIPQLELSNMDLMVKFAENGLGIACVAKDYVQQELQNKQLYEVLLQEKIKPRKIGIAIKKGAPLSAATAEFLNMMNKEWKPKNLQ